jgi:hypothetical protein
VDGVIVVRYAPLLMDVRVNLRGLCARRLVGGVEALGLCWKDSHNAPPTRLRYRAKMPRFLSRIDRKY